MRPGTIVCLPDGRVGTVVYNGLDGYGIKWGRHPVAEADMNGTDGGLFQKAPDDWPWFPDAMLRDPYPRAHLECVGVEFTVLEETD